MEEETNVPASTVRVLASLLALGFDVARERASAILERLRPLVEPPDDLRVSSRVGTRYSGVVVLDRGEIIAGVVVATGHDANANASAGLPSRTNITPPPAGSYGSSSSGKLPGWAEDPRDLYDDRDEPWRRR